MKKILLSMTLLLFISAYSNGVSLFAQDTTTVSWQHDASFGKDNIVRKESPEINFGLNVNMSVGIPTVNYRSFIQFDSLQYIPSNATIIDARLILSWINSSGTPDTSISFHRVTTPWNEGPNAASAGFPNWDSLSTSSAWTTPGGDFNSTKYATRAGFSGYTAGDTVIFRGNLKDLIQDWVDGTQTNNGMVVKFDDESSGWYFINFGSSDRTTASDRPKLEVTYTVVTAPPTPTGVTATDGTIADHVQVEWNDVAAADSFKVLRASASGGPYSLVATTADTTYNDTGAPIYTVNAPTTISATTDSVAKIVLSWSGQSITDGATRHYKVIAFNTGGESDTSSSNSGFRDDTLPAASAQIDTSFVEPNNFGVFQSDKSSPFTHSPIAAGDSAWYRVRVKSTAGTFSGYTSTAVGRAAPNGFIQVTVKSSQDSSLLENAQVILTGIDTSLTNASGEVVFADLSPVSGYSVDVSKALFAGNSASGINVTSEDTTFVTVFLTPLPGFIKGIAVDSLSGNGLINVIATVTPGNYVDTTDAGGNFLVSGIEPNTGYTVTLTKTFYNDKAVGSLTVTSSDTTNAGTIEMVATDSAGMFIDIDLDDGTNTNNMQFGFHPEGTDGFESFFNETQLPPVPVSGAFFDTRFTNGSALGNGSLIDIRNNVFDTLNYFIDIQRISLGDVISVSWDTINDIGKKFTLVELINGTIPGETVNMLQNTSHVLSDTSVTQLKIVVGPIEFITWSNNYAQGWNLVSLGGEYISTSLSFIFPTANSPAFKFNTSTQNYESVTSLEPGVGYFVDFATAYNAARTAEIIDSLSLSLTSGWNMIGTTSGPVALSDINDPSSVVVSIYKNTVGVGYSLVTDSLRQGEGYWMNASANGSIDFVGGALNKGGSGIYYLDAVGNDERAFGISVDTDYGTQILDIYTGEASREVNRSFSLPPLAPYENAAIRFNLDDISGMNGLYVTEGKELRGSISINVPKDNRTLVLRWDNNNLKRGEFFLRDGVEGALFADVDMTEQTELSLSGLNIDQVQFEYEGRAPIVDDYALLPNYPNPFNPETNISYRIKEAGLVKLTIYNILGQEVRALVHGIQNAGSFTVKWNGRDNFGRQVAGGMYIYRLEAKGFTASRKLLLIK